MNKNKWIEYALSQGMESVEIYQSLSTQKEITWFSGQMDTFVSSHVLGTMIRGIVDGNMEKPRLDLAVSEPKMSLIKRIMIKIGILAKAEKQNIVENEQK